MVGKRAKALRILKIKCVSSTKPYTYHVETVYNNAFLNQG